MIPGLATPRQTMIPGSTGRISIGNLELDARRVVWLPESRTLVAADLHLGFAWVQRHRGQLLPVAPDSTLDRLEKVVHEWKPLELVLLGDIVHAAVPLKAVEMELRRLAALQRTTRLALVLGNHDRRLEALLRSIPLDLECHTFLRRGSVRLQHGDVPVVDPESARMSLLGHEHPAILLGDGVATHVRCPAFLSGPETIVLPAFGDWSAGTVIRRGAFLGPVAKWATFDAVYACVGKRLLPMPW